MKQVPSDDPTSYTSQELVEYINETWKQVRESQLSGDPILTASLQLKIRVVRKELETRHRLKIQLSPQQRELWPSMMTMKEFLDKPSDPTRWIWEDCLPLGASSILVAAPKTGKTNMAVALSIAVARGYPFLNRGIQQSPVGYIFLDGHYEELREVFQKFGAREEDDIRIHTGSATMGKPVDWAIDQIKNHKLKFLVIDTLQKVFRFRNINDYSEVTNVLEPLNKAQQDFNCCTLYLHHAGKANDKKGDLDSAIGSNALRGNFYTFLHLKRLVPDDWKSIRIFRSDQRSGRNFDETAISNGENGEIEKIGTVQDAWISTKKPEVKEFIQQNPGCQGKEIQMAIEGYRRIIGLTIQALMKENEIERTGVGGRGDPFKYYVAGSLVKEAEPVSAVNLFEVKKWGAK